MLACPVDGTVSQAGVSAGETLLQAKGQPYSLTALLAGDAELAARFHDGAFATLYLAPHNYHRIHMPCAGTLEEMIFVPGSLYSVNAATERAIPGLFARNERVLCLFDTAAGPMAVVLVGAPHRWQHGDGLARRGTRDAAADHALATMLQCASGRRRARPLQRRLDGHRALRTGRARWDGSIRTGEQVRVGQRLGVVT